MDKKMLALPATLALCCTLTGCSGLASAEQNAVYDDDARIAQEGGTYTAVNLRGSFDSPTLSIGELTGSYPYLLLTTPSESGKLRIDYDLALTAGNCKLVLVENARDVDVVCEGTEQGSRTFDLSQGDYALKIVGSHAGADLSLKLAASEGIEAEVPGDGFDKPRAVELEPFEG